MAPRHVSGMPIPDNAVAGPEANEWAMWPQEGVQHNGLAIEAQENAQLLDLNMPAQVKEEMDIDDMPVPQPDIPAQLQEPPLHASESLSDDSPAVSLSSVAVQQDLNALANSDDMVVMALAAPQAQPEPMLDLNAGLEPMQEIQIEQAPPAPITASLDQAPADNVPILPELNLEQMMDEDEPPAILRQHNDGVVHQDLQLGFVQTPDFAVDLVFEAFQLNSPPKINADAVRIWAHHFSPTGHKDSVVHIPAELMPFFLNILMSPTHFSWAKNFLSA